MANAEDVAEGAHVLGVIVDGPSRRAAAVRAAVAAEVQADDLRHIAELREAQLEHGVAEPGPPTATRA